MNSATGHTSAKIIVDIVADEAYQRVEGVGSLSVGARTGILAPDPDRWGSVDLHGDRPPIWRAEGPVISAVMPTAHSGDLWGEGRE